MGKCGAGLYTQDYDLIGVPSWWNRAFALCADTFWSNQEKTAMENGALGSEYQVGLLFRFK
jgi:hypothetical protein